MTAEIGRVLGGRYRLVAPIGMGASAQVYLADDVKLRRRVALKMLHDALAGDAEFLRRFRAEARAAAALSHPNVMAVYDWSDGSEHGDAAFIVTEYLPGGSLRSLLDSGALLTPSQALGVGLEAARALDYAHRRGFVHRDIKPANLLFGEEQRLRIADFGLARALAEAAWTEPQGAVLGTARYASPEQAKGESLTGKADVYSLALTLVEAVTGDVPFVADTTLGTLMARVDRPMIVSDALGPLQGVIIGAGHPDPEQRIDARTLAKGLLRAAHELSRPASLPLVGALAAGSALLPDADPTIHASGPGAPSEAAPTDMTAEDLELEPPAWVNQAEPADELKSVEVAPGPGPAPAPAPEIEDGDGDGDEVEALDGPAPLADALDGAPEEVAPAATPGPSTEEVAVVEPDASSAEDPREVDADLVVAGSRSRRRRWPWAVLAAAVVLGGGGAAAAVVANQDDAPPPPAIDLPVPSLVGRTQAEATAIAEAAGWTVTTVLERRDGTTKGEVLETSPEPGGRLVDGQPITLTVSEGQTIVDVPADLAGMAIADALTALEAAGLKADVADTPYSEEVAKDVVISVVEGTPGQLEKGSVVPLVLSNGPEPRVVPSGLVGSTESAAIEALAALRLDAAIVRSFSDSAPEGQVISVLPRSGTTVERGTSVNVEVSRGPELVAVPDVSGASSTAEAIATLRSAGLREGNVSGPAAGTPQGTSPGAGELVRPGSTVNIILG